MTEPRGEPGLDLDVLGAALKEGREWMRPLSPIGKRALDAGDALLAEVRTIGVLLTAAVQRANEAEAEVRRLTEQVRTSGELCLPHDWPTPLKESPK